MSFLDNLLSAYGASGASRPRPVSSFADVPQAVGGLEIPNFDPGSGSSRQAGFPDRIDVSPDSFKFKIGDTDVTGAVEFGAGAAQAPGYLRERPVAALDTLIGNATGVKPADEIGKFVKGIPILGPVLDTATNLVNGQAVAGALNGGFVGVAAGLHGQPDSYELPGIIRLATELQPVPSLRLPKTLGDLRRELFARGISPEEIADVAAGRMSQWDFGDRMVSSNAWESLFTSLALDPTNILLATPLGGVKASALAARVGLSGSKVVGVVRGAEIFDTAIAKGLAKTALDSKQAAAAIARGVPGTEATLAGLGQFFKVVTRGGKAYFGIKGQVATTLAPLAIDVLADHTDKGTPVGGFFENLRSVADQIENNRPLSHNALFSMYSALNFPLRTYAKQGWGTVVAAKNRAFGAGEIDRFSKALGVSKKNLAAWAGGHENVAAFVDFLDEKIALERIKSHPLDVAYLGSMEEAAVRFAKTRDLTAAVVADMRAKGEITMAERAAMAKDWYTAQGEGNGYRGVRQQWDPELAMKNWQEYQGLASHLQPMLAQHGVTLGLNDASSSINSTISKEAIGDFLTMARRKAVNGHVAPRDLQALLDVLPLHKVGTKTDYWDRIFIRDARPISIKSLESKLGRMKADAPAIADLMGGFTRREAEAARAVPGHVMPEAGAGALNNTLEGAAIGASRMRPEIAKELGFAGDSASTLFEARVARAHPTVTAAERDVPKALAQAGFPVQVAKRTFGGWDGGLEPSFVSVLAPGPIQDLRLASAMAGHVLDQDAVLVRVVGGADLRAAGVASNSTIFRLEGLPSAYGDTIYSLTAKAFPDGFTYDQVAGALEMVVSDEGAAAALAKVRELRNALRGAIPQEAAGGAIIARPLQRRAYAEWLGRDAYGQVIDDAVRAGDPRVYAFDALASDLAGASERAANLALSEGGGSLGGALGLGGDRLPRSPRDWGDVVPGEVSAAGRPASAAQELREAVDARGFGGDASYVSFARRLDQDVSDTFPLPRERVRPVDGPEFFDMDPAEYNRPLIEAPTEVVPATELVRFEQAADDLPARIQAAYDAGDIELGQQLQRQAGGTAESGGAVLDELDVHAVENYAFRAAPRGVATKLDAVFEKVVPAIAPATLYRSISGSRAQKLRELVGGEFVDHGYMSTATSSDLAAGYARGYSPDEVIIRVEAPAGARLLDVDAALNSEHAMPALRGRQSTGERILPRDSRFAVELEGDQIVLRLKVEAPAGSTVAERAIFEAAQAGEEIGLRPGIDASIKDAPAEYLVRRDAETGEWVPLLSHEAALADARAAGRAPLPGMHPALRNFDPATLRRINELEAWIRTEYPRYRLEAAPKIATSVKPKNARQVALGEYNAIGEWLFGSGKGNVFSPLFNFMHWAMTPVRNLALHSQAEQALMSEVISRGGTSEQVAKFLSLARLEAEATTFGSRNVRLFRDWSSLPANTINRLATEAGMPPSVTEAFGPGRFHTVVDRATSRFYRNLRQADLKGGARGRIARGVETLYGGLQNGTGVHYLYDLERATAKVFYHIFRFVSDPRWWMYNILEADTINAARYGIGSTRFTSRQATHLGDQAAFVHGEQRLPTAGELARTTKKGRARGNVPAGQRFLYKDEAPGHYSGWNDNRNLSAYIIKAFDGERATSTGAALRNLGENHPVITALRDRFGEDVETWVKGLDETMYRFDTLGVKGTIDDAARELEAQGLMSIPEMRPFIEQLYNRNQQLYDDIVRNLHGNAKRTNLERLMNSYWLYWPISYQLKAGKWLLDVLTHKFAGRETNLGGLYAYENLRAKHMQLMAQDPEYAAVFDENPELWFAAQMLLPITPNDMGISLSRPVRYGLSFAKDVTGGDEGPLAFLHHYKTAEDPVLAAAQILNIGPIYTWNQFQEVLGDLQDNTDAIDAADQAPL